ncbi:hypothetical protein PR048_024341 [Dryococelus australis]|uniref:Uncharacterized protein n=1 Tax=Dryococelus australis TaxID=614101 RepID=A0ABQ9GND3_9NEOP|nr:hypothetical protein PR048_024341 [Dryococelus australis]
MERRPNERAGETGDPRENPLTNSIVGHDSHLRKSGDQAGTRKPGDLETERKTTSVTRATNERLVQSRTTKSKGKMGPQCYFVRTLPGRLSTNRKLLTRGWLNDVQPNEKVKRVLLLQKPINKGQLLEYGRRKREIPKKTPPNNGIVRHDSQMRKSEQEREREREREGERERESRVRRRGRKKCLPRALQLAGGQRTLRLLLCVPARVNKSATARSSECESSLSRHSRVNLTHWPTCHSLSLASSAVQGERFRLLYSRAHTAKFPLSTIFDNKISRQNTAITFSLSLPANFDAASQKQSSDTHKTPYDRVKRCQERITNINASERVNPIPAQRLNLAELVLCPVAPTSSPIGHRVILVPNQDPILSWFHCKIVAPTKLHDYGSPIRRSWFQRGLLRHPALCLEANQGTACRLTYNLTYTNNQALPGIRTQILPHPRSEYTSIIQEMRSIKHVNQLTSGNIGEVCSFREQNISAGALLYCTTRAVTKGRLLIGSYSRPLCLFCVIGVRVNQLISGKYRRSLLFPRAEHIGGSSTLLHDSRVCCFREQDISAGALLYCTTRAVTKGRLLIGSYSRPLCLFCVIGVRVNQLTSGKYRRSLLFPRAGHIDGNSTLLHDSRVCSFREQNISAGALLYCTTRAVTKGRLLIGSYSRPLCLFCVIGVCTHGILRGARLPASYQAFIGELFPDMLPTSYVILLVGVREPMCSEVCTHGILRGARLPASYQAFIGELFPDMLPTSYVILLVGVREPMCSEGRAAADVGCKNVLMLSRDVSGRTLIFSRDLPARSALSITVVNCYLSAGLPDYFLSKVSETAALAVNFRRTRHQDGGAGLQHVGMPFANQRSVTYSPGGGLANKESLAAPRSQSDTRSSPETRPANAIRELVNHFATACLPALWHRHNLQGDKQLPPCSYRIFTVALHRVSSPRLFSRVYAIRTQYNPSNKHLLCCSCVAESRDVYVFVTAPRLLAEHSAPLSDFTNQRRENRESLQNSKWA